MNVVRGIIAVAGFQLRRMLAPQRLVVAAIGAAFPAAVVLAARRITGGLDRDYGVMLLYALVPEAVCLLGLLLTMCPVVADELERGTWQHVVVRPGGRRSLLLGTFVAAVVWTVSVALLSLVRARRLLSDQRSAVPQSACRACAPAPGRRHGVPQAGDRPVASAALL